MPNNDEWDQYKVKSPTSSADEWDQYKSASAKTQTTSANEATKGQGFLGKADQVVGRQASGLVAQGLAPYTESSRGYQEAKKAGLGTPSALAYGAAKGIAHLLPGAGDALTALETAGGYEGRRQAGYDPVYSVAAPVLAPQVGVNLPSMESAAGKGDTSGVLAEAAVPAAEAGLGYTTHLAGPSVRGAAIRSVKPALMWGADIVQHPEQVAGRALKWGINKALEEPASIGKSPAQVIAEQEGAGKQAAATGKAVNKLEQQYIKAGTKTERKGSTKTPRPYPFSPTATSSANVGPEAFVPQESRNLTPFQPVVQGNVISTAPPVDVSGITPPPPRQVAAPPPAAEGLVSQPGQPTSLLSRGRTLVTPGMEPDLHNPTHVKMINDYQTMSGPALRMLSEAGDRFAAFVLRHMPRP